MAFGGNKCVVCAIIGCGVVFGIIGPLLTIYGLVSTRFHGKYDDLMNTKNATIPLIIGVAFPLLFVASIVGCCAATCQNRYLLISFSLLMAIIVVLELVVIIAEFTASKNKDEMKQRLNDTMNEYKSNKKIQTVWDDIQKTMMCCGVFNYSDWKGNVPVSCCEKEVNESEKCPEDDLFKKGCWDSLDSYLAANRGIADFSVALLIFQVGRFGFSVALLIFQILPLACGFVMAKEIKKEQKEEVDAQTRDRQHAQEAEE